MHTLQVQYIMYAPHTCGLSCHTCGLSSSTSCMRPTHVVYHTLQVQYIMYVPHTCGLSCPPCLGYAELILCPPTNSMPMYYSLLHYACVSVCFELSLPTGSAAWAIRVRRQGHCGAASSARLDAEVGFGVQLPPVGRFLRTCAECSPQGSRRGTTCFLRAVDEVQHASSGQ